MIFGTYPKEDATAEQIELSEFMRGAWAQFARDPAAGPGWEKLGDGSDYGVIGTEPTVGVTVVDREEVDTKCELFAPIYNALN